MLVQDRRRFTTCQSGASVYGCAIVVKSSQQGQERPAGGPRGSARALMFTSGSAVEVLTAAGSAPTSQWNVRGKISRSYDASLRSYVLVCEGGPTTRMALPKDERKSLALPHRWLVLQTLLPREKPFSFELALTDASSTRRRLAFSTSLKEAVTTPLHTRVPLADVPRGVWLNLVLDLAALSEACFGPASAFLRLDALALGAACKVRRIFVLRALSAAPTDASPDEAAVDDAVDAAALLSGDAPHACMPRAWALAPAVDAGTHVLARLSAEGGSRSPVFGPDHSSDAGFVPGAFFAPVGGGGGGACSASGSFTRRMAGGHSPPPAQPPTPWSRDGSSVRGQVRSAAAGGTAGGRTSSVRTVHSAQPACALGALPAVGGSAAAAPLSARRLTSSSRRGGPARRAAAAAAARGGVAAASPRPPSELGTPVGPRDGSAGRAARVSLADTPTPARESAAAAHRYGTPTSPMVAMAAAGAAGAAAADGGAGLSAGELGVRRRRLRELERSFERDFGLPPALAAGGAAASASAGPSGGASPAAADGAATERAGAAGGRPRAAELPVGFAAAAAAVSAVDPPIVGALRVRSKSNMVAPPLGAAAAGAAGGLGLRLDLARYGAGGGAGRAGVMDAGDLTVSSPSGLTPTPSAGTHRTPLPPAGAGAGGGLGALGAAGLMLPLGGGPAGMARGAEPVLDDGQSDGGGSSAGGSAGGEVEEEEGLPTRPPTAEAAALQHYAALADTRASGVSLAISRSSLADSLADAGIGDEPSGFAYDDAAPLAALAPGGADSDAADADDGADAEDALEVSGGGFDDEPALGAGGGAAAAAHAAQHYCRPRSRGSAEAKLPADAAAAAVDEEAALSAAGTRAERADGSDVCAAVAVSAEAVSGAFLSRVDSAELERIDSADAEAVDDDSVLYGSRMHSAVHSRVATPACAAAASAPPQPQPQPHAAALQHAQAHALRGARSGGTPGERDIFSPLVIPPSVLAARGAEVGGEHAAEGARGHAPHPPHQPPRAAQVASLEGGDDDVVDLLYDPTLNVYFNPKSGKYYEFVG